MIRPDDTIVAVSTPIGEGGIGIVRLSGKDALKIADKFFMSKGNRKPSGFGTYTVHYGYVVKKRKAKNKKYDIVDEVILTVMKAPKSYTREDIVEINCHGGIQAVKNVLELTVLCGARLAEPGEFTKRAFLNGRIDLVQAEAVLDTIRAKTESSLKVAINQLEGGLSKGVNLIRDKLIEITAEIEASIDFPDEGIEADERAILSNGIEEILDQLKTMLSTYNNGLILREGVLAMICGKPNVGKSSLMNLLLKRDRVIVSPIPGTTRDTVEEVINLKGIPVRLVDTAGITKTKNAIEKEGVSRAKRYLELADFVLLIFDASTAMDKSDRDIIKFVDGKKRLVILNKCDIGKKTDATDLRRFLEDDNIIEISVSKKHNIKDLERAIVRMIWSGKFTQGEGAIIANARHKELLDKAYRNVLSVKRAFEASAEPEIVAVDLKEAIFNLGLVVGRSVSEDILDRIFERFCIGK